MEFVSIPTTPHQNGAQKEITISLAFVAAFGPSSSELNKHPGVSDLSLFDLFAKISLKSCARHVLRLYLREGEAARLKT